MLSASTGAPERALVLGGAIAAFRKQVKAGGRQHEEELLTRALDWARRERGASARQLWSAGSRLRLGDVIGIALEEIPLPAPDATGN